MKVRGSVHARRKHTAAEAPGGNRISQSSGGLLGRRSLHGTQERKGGDLQGDESKEFEEAPLHPICCWRQPLPQLFPCGPHPSLAVTDPTVRDFPLPALESIVIAAACGSPHLTSK